MPGTLYIVATPIGNMNDVSARMTSTLQSVDVVFAEDTRVAKSLLHKLDIKVTVKRYDHHSHEKQIRHVLEELEAGHDIAYVSDAGTPGIEDPGGRLVESVAKILPDAPIVPISGPSAIITALSVCGFPADKFNVMGFAPKKKGRQTYFDNVAASTITTVLYESTHRIHKTVDEIASRQPDRRMVIARELTKKFETIMRGTASELVERLATASTKGEFVIVLE
ncbi:MAG TPA: 16S rRNA (cytidine(1402)-2'-O)-methyltransferase [Patescibacteria group bacterium]|nr:16S rRNA (cytidine(1402)-2'-O)-methyltransferase [Patescibacteria group bacterium]